MRSTTTPPDRPHATLVDSLNPEQREAVEHATGPGLVLAGAGSGKTRVLTTRICHLVLERGVPPEGILAVTFTNKAAREMRSRVARVLGPEGRGVWLGTFHSFGARLLRLHAPLLGWSRRFAIRDAEQSARETRKAQLEVDSDPKRWSPRVVRSRISDAKNHLVGVEEFVRLNARAGSPLARQVARVYPAYEAALRRQDAVDFDDLLVHPVRLLESDVELLDRYRSRFEHILVDEYQDTNRAQFRLLELLAGPRGNLMVVGDDDQSIYGWRGADLRNILDFERTFPEAKVVRLERNYRSTRAILDAANRVIAQNAKRRAKSLRTDRAGGAAPVCLRAADELDEARWIVGEIERLRRRRPLGSRADFAVLYRTNAQSRALEEGFRRGRAPYRIVGGVRFYERREVQDALGYLRLVANPKDMDAFDRVVNYPRRGVGATTLVRLREFATERGLSLLEAAARVGEAAGLTRAARRELKRFADLTARYRDRARLEPAGDLIEALVDELGLIPLLLEREESAERADNVRELVAAAHAFDPSVALESHGGERGELTDLDLFLQHAALATDLDGHDLSADAATLTTVHNAKGLEFDVVFVSGMEEGLFPLAHAQESSSALEEERRLFYVAITRARKRLYFTHAHRRRRAGETFRGRRSSFMDAIMGQVERKSTQRAGAAAAGAGFRGGSRGGRGPRTRSAPDDLGSGDWGATDFHQDRPRYLRGERVRHARFGAGAVVALSGFGMDLRVVVDFDEHGRKTLVARHASLERDDFR